MRLDNTTRQAVQHTVHCLIGCGIGEVLGMFIGAMLGWDAIGRISLAIGLAFLFGYSLTYWGVRKHASSTREAIKTTLATDTVSITTMEIVANVTELLLPGAISSHPTDLSFWWSLAIAMGIAFVITVPVNRFMISKNPGQHMHHH